MLLTINYMIGGVWSPGLYGEDGNDVLIGGPGIND